METGEQGTPNRENPLIESLDAEAAARVLASLQSGEVDSASGRGRVTRTDGVLAERPHRRRTMRRRMKFMRAALAGDVSMSFVVVLVFAVTWVGGWFTARLMQISAVRDQIAAEKAKWRHETNIDTFHNFALTIDRIGASRENREKYDEFIRLFEHEFQKAYDEMKAMEAEDD